MCVPQQSSAFLTVVAEVMLLAGFTASLLNMLPWLDWACFQALQWHHLEPMSSTDAILKLERQF